MNEEQAKELLEAYDEALDFLWNGNGQSLQDRKRSYHDLREQVLKAMTKTEGN